MIFRVLADKYALLDALPDSLYAETVTHPHGALLPRAAAVLQWRACLLQGWLPDESALDWPDRPIRRALLMRLEALDVAKFCRDQENLTDSILKDVLEGVYNIEQQAGVRPEFNDKLAQRQNIVDRDSSFKDEASLADHVASNRVNPLKSYDDRGAPAGGDGAPAQIDWAPKHAPESAKHTACESDWLPRPTPEPMQLSPHFGLAQKCEIDDGEIASTTRHTTVAADHLHSKWQELATSWHELSEVYGGIGAMLGHGWDLSQGLLAAQGWRDIVRYRKLLTELPDLKELLAMLGRLRAEAEANGDARVLDEVFAPLKRAVPDAKPNRNEHPAMETGGIILSADISRLLPAELALLGHPQLKWLWHAKRAESKLFTYCHCGLLPDPLLEESGGTEESRQDNKQTASGYGPIIVCLDTSGSMRGRPEKLSKAAVLEALRIASSENRQCCVYAFGGPGQILEHELDLARGGIAKLLQFLRFSFLSGTDVVQPLLLALQKQQSENWRDADILLVSDGRFPLPDDSFETIESLRRQRGLRLHGLLLGNWKSRALETLCDPLHTFY